MIKLINYWFRQSRQTDSKTGDKMTEQQYLKDCTEFFAPLDEIAEALINEEGVNGISYTELKFIVDNNHILMTRLSVYL